MAERQKRGRWGLFLVFWCVLLLGLGFLGCLFFYKYAADYEATRPEISMDALMESMSEDDWHDALAPTVGEVSRYEDTAALFEGYFDRTVRGKTLSYRRDMSRSDRTQTTFVVYAGPSRIGEVRLVPVEGDLRFGFGRSAWELESITATPLTKSLQALTVQIDAPDGVTPSLNGVALGQEQIADPAVALTELSALEQRFENKVRMVRYEVSPLFGQITVTDAEGNEIAPVGDPAGGVVRYVIPPTQTWSFRVEAPEGVTVSVCGAVLGEDEILGRESTMFRKLEAYLPEGGYETLLYGADGLYTEPVVSAEYAGIALTPVVAGDGKLLFFYPSDADTAQDERDAASGFFNAYMQFSSYKYNSLALKDVTDRILPGTELYNYMKNSYDAMIWASATEAEGQELRIDNFHRVGENCFTCTIFNKADYTATQWHRTESYAREDGYKMVFLRQGGVWLAATMSAFE